MASINKTPKLNLSQYVASDKPAWLTDYNNDMAKIDAAVGAVESTVEFTVETLTNNINERLDKIDNLLESGLNKSLKTKLAWSGSWESGEITIPGIQNHPMIFVTIENAGSAILSKPEGSTSFVGGTMYPYYPDGALGMDCVCFILTVPRDDTLNMARKAHLTHTSASGHSAVNNTTSKITEIYYFTA